MTLYFYNPGEIDIRGATIAGLSAKEDSDSAIGFFGTGLKYSIASILRWGGDITIWSGDTPYKFEVEKMQFRDKEFEQIVLRFGGETQTLGFTTEYGKKWQGWQVFRELYSNALDEGGHVTDKEVYPESGSTLIVVNCPVLDEPYEIKDEIVLRKNIHWVYETPRLKLADEISVNLYYKGVRVWKGVHLFTWNAFCSSHFELSEDRDIKNIYMARILMQEETMQCTDEELIFRILTADKQFGESLLEYPSHYKVSEEFLSVAKRLWKQDPKRYEKLRAVIEKHAPELTEPKEVELTPIMELQLKKAVVLADRMQMSPLEYKISVRDLGESRLGTYNSSTGQIYLSPEVFNQGTKQVLSTLYEELLHAKTGKQDCTYNMQTFLFNKIISMYEEHVFKEPI